MPAPRSMLNEMRHISLYIYITSLPSPRWFVSPASSEREPSLLGAFLVPFFLSLAFALYFRRLRGHFGSPEGSKSVTLARYLLTFRGPGTHVRIELSLQSQHDLEGSGGSENRRFLDVFLDGPQDVIREPFLPISRDLGSRMWPHWPPKCFPNPIQLIVCSCFGLSCST